MSKKEELRYLELRAKFQAELDEITNQLTPLLNRHADLQNLLDGKSTTTHQLDALKERILEVTEPVELPQTTSEELLVDFLVLNPGSSKDDIRTFFDGRLSESKLKLLIGKLSKRGSIVNQSGNKRYAEWHVV